jgi:hypothetical protein
MSKRLVRGLVAVGLVATTVAVARRLLGPASGSTARGAKAAPVIGGDTWPPVPVNPERPA